MTLLSSWLLTLAVNACELQVSISALMGDTLTLGVAPVSLLLSSELEQLAPKTHKPSAAVSCVVYEGSAFPDNLFQSMLFLCG
jgi:hypothetical protein